MWLKSGHKALLGLPLFIVELICLIKAVLLKMSCDISA